jgi:S1-C subfamily serine protease
LGKLDSSRYAFAGKTLAYPKCKTPVLVPDVSKDAAGASLDSALSEPGLGPEPGPKPAAEPPSTVTCSRPSRDSWKPVALVAAAIALVPLLGIVVLLLGGPPAGGPSADQAVEVRRLEGLLEEGKTERARFQAELDRVAAPDAAKAIEQQITESAARQKSLARDLEAAREEGRNIRSQIQALEGALARHSEQPAAPAPQPPPQPRPPPGPQLPPAPAPMVPPLTPPKANPASGEMSIADLVEKHGNNVVVVRTEAGVGAGFIVTADGFVVTNLHVISGATRFEVHSLTGGKNPRRAMAAGTPYAADPANDLALLKIAAADPLESASLGTDERVRAGDRVVAIGNPGIGGVVLERTVTTGIISSLERRMENRVYLQTSAAVNPGNSGGPLFSMSGKVIGVVTAKAREGESIGFAVPVAWVARLLAERDGAFRISEPFKQWEARQGILAPRPNLGGARTLPIEGSISQILLSEDGQSILALDFGKNSLHLVSAKEFKLEATVVVGSDPTHMAFAAGGVNVWISCRGSQNLVWVMRINLQRSIGRRFPGPGPDSLRSVEASPLSVPSDYLWFWPGAP